MLGAVTKSVAVPRADPHPAPQRHLRGAFLAWYPTMAVSDTMGSVVMDDHPGVLHGLPVAVFRTASRPNRTFCSSTTHPPAKEPIWGHPAGWMPPTTRPVAGHRVGSGSPGEFA